LLSVVISCRVPDSCQNADRPDHGVVFQHGRSFLACLARGRVEAAPICSLDLRDLDLVDAAVT
jgi:hypothetical protein